MELYDGDQLYFTTSTNWTVILNYCIYGIGQDVVEVLDCARIDTLQINKKNCDYASASVHALPRQLAREYIIICTY